MLFQVKLRYEDGVFKPISPIPPMADGDEFQVSMTLTDLGAGIDEMLNRTRGMWADVEEDVEGYMEEVKAKMMQADMEKMQVLLDMYNKDEK